MIGALRPGAHLLGRGAKFATGLGEIRPVHRTNLAGPFGGQILSLFFKSSCDMKNAMQTIRFGHSPDPDDAFMFYAIAKKKIDLQGFKIVHKVEDIESLNRRALRGELEATAVSVHAYAYLADQYAVMRSGASIGEKYGPIVVARPDFTPSPLSSPLEGGEGRVRGY